MMINMKSSDDGKFGALVETAAGAVAQVQGDNATHSYSIEERTSFANLINHELAHDEDLKDRLPMNTENEDLFHVFDDGILMAKLLLQIDRECIDERAINNKANMNVYEVQENLKMGITAAKGLGIKMIGIDPRDFINKTPHLILTFVW